MISDLFLNACILVAFVSISHIYFKDKETNNGSSLPFKITTGIISGLLGIILMLYSVNVTFDVMIDFRYIPILLAAIYVGFFPVIIAAIVIGGFRILFFGISRSSIAGFIITFIVGMGFCIICSLKLSRNKKWIYSIVLLILMFSIGLFMVVGKSIIFFKTIAVYSVGNIVVSFIVYLYSENLIKIAKFNKKLKDEATKDFLTGLNNVRNFDDSFNSISQLALRRGESLSLVFIDIDHFKKINDTYGHKIGDMVLKGVSDIFIDTVRAFDIVSRNGGEEFSILLLGCLSSHALEIAERLRKKVAVHKFIISDKVVLNITISIGVSTYPDTTDKIQNLLEDADKALYDAKKTGRNKAVLYKP